MTAYLHPTTSDKVKRGANIMQTKIGARKACWEEALDRCMGDRISRYTTLSVVVGGTFYMGCQISLNGLSTRISSFRIVFIGPARGEINDVQRSDRAPEDELDSESW